MNKNLLNKIALVAGGVLIGSGTTYLIVERKLRLKYETALAEEIQSIRRAADSEIEHAKEGFKLLHKEPPYDDPRTAVKAYGERLDELQYHFENGVPEDSDEETPVHDQLVEDKVLEKTAADLERLDDFKKSEEFVEQLLTGATEAVQYDVRPPSQAQKILNLEDMAATPSDIPEGNIFENFKEGSVPVTSLRDKERPYLILEEEYHTNEPKHEQLVLLYYADEVLADEKGGVVGRASKLLGDDSLKHFGYDPENPNTLFIRNDKRKTDFEVIRLDGTHGELVLGIAPKD